MTTGTWGKNLIYIYIYIQTHWYNIIIITCHHISLELCFWCSSKEAISLQKPVPLMIQQMLEWTATLAKPMLKYNQITRNFLKTYTYYWIHSRNIKWSKPHQHYTLQVLHQGLGNCKHQAPWQYHHFLGLNYITQACKLHVTYCKQYHQKNSNSIKCKVWKLSYQIPIWASLVLQLLHQWHDTGHQKHAYQYIWVFSIL